MENKYTYSNMKKDIYVFITISILSIIILLYGLDINADGSSYWNAYGITDNNIYELESQYLVGNNYKICMTLEQYRASSIYDSNVSSRMPSLYSVNTIEGYLWNNQSTSSDYFISPLLKSIPTDINPAEYPYFLITTESTTSTNMDSFNVYFFSENTNFISMGSYVFLTSDTEDLFKVCKYNYYNGVYTNASGFNNPNEYSDLGMGTIFYLYYTNMPILCSDTYFSNYYEGRDYFYEHPENFVDQNYLLYDSQGNPNYTNPNINGGNGSISQSDVEKGLYLLKGSCVYLDNKSFNDGTLYVNALLTDDQKSNSNLQLAVKGSCTYSFEQTALSSTRQHVYASGYTSDGKEDMLKILWGSDADGVSSHSKTVNCTFGVLGFMPYSMQYISDNKATNKSTLSEVNSNMFTSELSSSGFTFGGANIRGIASAYDSVNSVNFSVNNAILNTGNGISYNIGFLDSAKQKTNVYLTDVRYHFELYMIDTTDENNYEWSDLIYSYDVDLLRGTSSVGTDGTLTYQDLDTIFDGDVPSEYLPSNNYDGDYSVSTGGSGSIVNNDNDIITIESNGEVAKDVINELIPVDSDADGLVEKIETYTDSNDFLALLQSTYSFVPSYVFVYMKDYFEIALGILAVGFVLRIILDLL